MKVLLVLLAVMVSSYALSLQDIDFTLLIQEGNPANDAVQAVYDLLRDLKQENLESQVAADQKNITDEEVGASVIGQLTNLMNMNKAAWEEARNHRDWVDSEITASLSFINWAQGRIAEIDRRSLKLEEMRCYSNNLFVRSIRQHQDALKVIRIMKQDLSGYLTGGASLVEVQVDTVADKLKMYSNLFNQKALEQFSQLASEQASGGAELHAQRNEQFTGTGAAGTPGQQQGDNVGQQVYNLLLQLEDELTNSLKVLEENEVAAAYQLADWLSDSEAEKSNLNQEIEKKTAYVEKLQLSSMAALASQAKANAALTESQAAVNQGVEDLQDRRGFWQSETNRRNEENAIIDEVIFVFKEQVKDMVGGKKTSFGKLL